MGNDLEFLDGVDDGRHCIGALESPEVIQSVGEKEVAAVRLTIDGGKDERRAHGNRGAEPSCSAPHTVLRDADGRHTWSQRQKLSKVASVERKVVDLFRGDHCAQIRRRYVKLLCFCGNGDYLRLRSDLQRNVY